MNAHTPTPWHSEEMATESPAYRIRGQNDIVATWVSPENAAFIIRTINSHETLIDALKSWKCPACGGKGTYQQNAVGRARDEARGRAPDPTFNPDPVTCKVCNGNGLHPIASGAIAKATNQ